jgi:hypothetical protein
MTTGNDGRGARRGALSFMAATALLSALGGLSVGGCGTAPEDICDLYCECQGCNAKERQKCLDDGEAAVADAEKRGCSSQYDDYLACVAREAECRNGNTFQFDGCDIEQEAIYACTGGNVCQQAAKRLCDQCKFSCANPDPASCTGSYECQSGCIMKASSCEEIANPGPNSAYEKCLQGC